MNADYLLTTDLARKLYQDYAKDLPIVDFHNHLSIHDLAVDASFANAADVWIKSDPYKHRAMRMCGEDEYFISGKATDYEKFCAWARTVPKLIGNPLYEWVSMELSQVFGIEKDLNEDTCEEIWNAMNECLKKPEFSSVGLLKRFKVEYAAPCSAITDDISEVKALDFLAPSLRADGMIPINTKFIQDLSKAADLPIHSLDDLHSALEKRIELFAQNGCRFSDHSFDHGFQYLSDDGKNEDRLQKLIAGQADPDDITALSSELIRMLGGLYRKYNMVMQLHCGAYRKTNRRLAALVGPAGGFAGIGNSDIDSLVHLLDDLEALESLPRTILFPLNAAQYEPFAILAGSYGESQYPGKVQLGPAWWWNDHLLEIRRALDVQCSYSVLSNSIGMTTDSRSLLSFVRHDYYRRVLCGWLGEKAARTEIPSDEKALGAIVRKLCYENAKSIIS